MKKQITFFLGAGASKAFGLPLTKELFPRFWKELWAGEILDNHQRKLLTNKFFKTVYPGLTANTKSKDLPDITDVLSLLDNFINNRTSPLKGLQQNDLLECRRALEVGIVGIIDDDYLESNPDDPREKLYYRFLDLLDKVSQKEKVNIITTNYDILVDCGLFYQIFEEDEEKFIDKVDFGIRWRDPHEKETVTYSPPANPTLSIYKLHGSSNWLTCNLCGQVYINLWGTVHHQINFNKTTRANTCHCGHARLNSMIVSPSMERIVDNASLKYIWNAALESLRTSDEWIIAGYSLPSEDLNIRSIMTRAFEGRKIKPKITVVQEGQGARNRYKSIFGKVSYMDKGMKQYIDSHK